MKNGVFPMRLVMQSTRARIGIEKTPHTQQIEQPHADFQLQTQHAKVQIRQTHAKVQIDQTKPFAESGLKGFLALTAENAQIARSLFLSGTAQIAEQGNEMSDIHKGYDAVVNQADANAFTKFNRDYGLVTMPRSRPDISIIEGKVDIQVIEGKVTNNTRARKPVHNYRQGKVSVYLAQRNSLNIQVEGSQLDLKA